MNKTKKVLSIILISLLILSTIFTLCKKVGLCAASEPAFFPYTPNGEIPVSSGVVNECLTHLQTQFPSVDFSSYFMFFTFEEWFYEPAQNSKLKVYFVPIGDSSFSATFINGVDYQTFYPASDGQQKFSINAPYYAVEMRTSNLLDKSRWIVTNNDNGTDLHIFSNINVDSTASTYGYDIVPWLPVYSSSDVFINNDQLIIDVSGGGSDSPGFNHYFWQNYQDSLDDIDNNSGIWKPNYQNPSNQQGFWDNVMDFFNRSFKSLLGGISGATKTIGDYIEQGLNFLYEFLTGYWQFLFEKIDSFFDLFRSHKDTTEDISEDTGDISGTVTSIDGRLATFFNNFWSNFDDHLEDFTEGIWGHLPDILKSPARIAHWFYTHGLKNGEFDFLTLWDYLFHFDSQSAYNLWSSNKYGDFILDVRDFFTNLVTSITGVSASDRVFFTISLGDHFGVAIPDIEIDFSWYASVRDSFLPYLMAFLYVSVVWLFIKRLPDILKGVAGAESSFVDNLPSDFTNVSYDSNTHIMSVVSGTRSRSGTTSTSVRKKV